MSNIRTNTAALDIKDNPFDLTIAVVNYNSADFILTSISLIERLTTSKWKMIICDNGSSHTDFVRVRNIVSRYDNITLIARTQTGHGSLGHGEALNILAGFIDTKYGAIMDADCLPLMFGWDSFLIRMLTDSVKIAGTPVAHNTPGTSQREKGFPLIFLSIFETQAFRSLDIDFRPRNISSGEDTGWELKEKFEANGFRGECLFGQNTRSYRDGKFSATICDEYYTDTTCKQLLCAHFGRGSNPRSGKYLGTFFGKKRKFNDERSRWLDICTDIADREVVRAINENKLPLEHVPCPSCHSDDVTKEFMASDWLFNTPGFWSIVRCTSCGLRRTNPRPKKSDLAKYYPSNYAPHHYVSDEQHHKFRALRLLFREQILRQHFGYFRTRHGASLFWWLVTLPFTRMFHVNLMPAFPKCSLNPRALEIGCSHGERLSQLSSLGWVVQGVEFSEMAAARARARGINCLTAFIEDCNFQKDEFDLVIMSMVLEHLGNPAAAIAQASEWIRPGGVLLVSVPNFSGIEARIFRQYAYTLQAPTHLTHFDKESLKALLLKFGFENVKIRSQGFHRDLRAGLQTYILDNPYSPARHLLRAPKMFFKLAGSLIGYLGISSRISVSAIRSGDHSVLE